jgi:hypothetical protein
MPDPGRRSLGTFAPSVDGEARLLLLIEAFSGGKGTLQGRTKLAKLDFLLRYPRFLRRALAIRHINHELDPSQQEENTIEQRMVRYKYGPWDPSYFALLGSLLGRGMIEPVPQARFIGFRTTAIGSHVARQLASSAVWAETFGRAQLLRRAFPTQGGTFLKNFIYENFPEVTHATWGERL